jgi:hypothetical protein
VEHRGVPNQTAGTIADRSPWKKSNLRLRALCTIYHPAEKKLQHARSVVVGDGARTSTPPAWLALRIWSLNYRLHPHFGNAAAVWKFSIITLDNWK